MPPSAWLHEEPLPPAIEEARLRLEAFLREEVRSAEQRHGVESEADASREMRRWVRQRSESLGLHRLTQPIELGGRGFGPLGCVAFHETIGASGCTTGRFALGSDGGLLRLGSPEQRERFLLPVLRGDLAMAFAFTDPQGGPRTTAVARGDGFAVTGVKPFVTEGVHADLLLVVGTVTEHPGGPTGPAVFVIRREAPGLRLRREFHTLDGGAHGDFELVEVQVPASDVLGQVGQALPAARENITGLRLILAATACGMARWAIEAMLERAERPHRSGTPLAARAEVQSMIAESVMDLLAARSALYAAARLAEAGIAVEAEVAAAKVLATEGVARVVDRAIQLAGGAGVVEGSPLALAYRRIRAWRIAEGTSEALRLVVGRAVLARRRAPAPGATAPASGGR
jgi:alkylation response protein AidB-like acyl-CoA dehydrogenase